MINIFNKLQVNWREYKIFNIHWNQWLLISITVLFLIIFLLVPLCLIFVLAFSEGYKIVIKNLLNENMLHAMFLTLITVLFTVPINVFFGTVIAWLVTRFNFLGKRLLLTLLNIPIAVSPVVAGLLYLLCYANTDSIIGFFLNLYDIQIVFTWVGIVLVTIFVTCPFVVHELVPMMVNQGYDEDEAAIILGASGWQMFRYVTLPNIRWPLLYGAIITNARTIGEFGAVSVVSGLIRGETYTISLYVELLYQDYNIVGSFVVASFLACISIFILFVKHYLKYRINK